MKVLLDCDPGHDDAMAIIYAARHLDLIGITTVFGNQSVELTTRNALSICQLLDLNVGVAKGAARPLVGKFRHGGDVHGASGLDGAELPVPTREALSTHAVDLIIETARAHRGELIIVATAPLTNIALALRKEPALVDWMAGISIMGGTFGIGNTSPVAEFNIYSDPEAAAVVFDAPVRKWMVGLDITRQVGVDEHDIAGLMAGGKVSFTIGSLLEFFRQRLLSVHGIRTASLHDPCALVPFVAPELISYAEYPVRVELQGRHTRGMTVVDRRNLTSEHLTGIVPRDNPNCAVSVDVNARALVDHILEAVRSFD